MFLSTRESLIIIGVISFVTFLTRALPFLLFPKNKPTPQFIIYLGKVLPYSIIGMLIIYCLKSISIVDFPFGLPELISVGLVAILHYWKGNNLLSIGGGTVFYMFLIQVVFI